MITGYLGYKISHWTFEQSPGYLQGTAELIDIFLINRPAEVKFPSFNVKLFQQRSDETSNFGEKKSAASSSRPRRSHAGKTPQVWSWSPTGQADGRAGPAPHMPGSVWKPVPTVQTPSSAPTSPQDALLVEFILLSPMSLPSDCSACLR